MTALGRPDPWPAPGKLNLFLQAAVDDAIAKILADFPPEAVSK